MQTHIKVVAVFFFIFGGLKLCGALFAPALLSVAGSFMRSSGDPDAANGAAVLGIVGVFATIYFLIFAIPALLTGWGLLTFKPWARIVAIVLAAFSIIEIPFGTIFGIYALWVMFNKETEALFKKPQAAPIV